LTEKKLIDLVKVVDINSIVCYSTHITYIIYKAISDKRRYWTGSQKPEARSQKPEARSQK